MFDISVTLEVLNELNYITYEGLGSKHDDALDCISMLASMETIAPSEGTVIESSAPVSSIWGKDEEDDEDSRLSTVF